MPFRRTLFTVTLLGLAACGDIPQITSAQVDAARAAPYPDLVPLDTLLQNAQTRVPQITSASITSMNSRIASLRARAAGLRRPVIDPATRAEMRAAQARAALR